LWYEKTFRPSKKILRLYSRWEFLSFLRVLPCFCSHQNLWWFRFQISDKYLLWSVQNDRVVGWNEFVSWYLFDLVKWKFRRKEYCVMIIPIVVYWFRFLYWDLHLLTLHVPILSVKHWVFFWWLQYFFLFFSIQR